MRCAHALSVSCRRQVHEVMLVRTCEWSCMKLQARPETTTSTCRSDLPSHRVLESLVCKNISGMYQPRINLTKRRYGGHRQTTISVSVEGLAVARRNVLVMVARRLCSPLLTAHADARSVRLHGRARSDLRQQLQGQGVWCRGFITCSWHKAWLTLENIMQEPFRSREGAFGFKFPTFRAEGTRVGAMAEGIAEVTFEVDPSEASSLERSSLSCCDEDFPYLAGVPLERHHCINLLPCGCKPGISGA